MQQWYPLLDPHSTECSAQPPGSRASPFSHSPRLFVEWRSIKRSLGHDGADHEVNTRTAHGSNCPKAQRHSCAGEGLHPLNVAPCSRSPESSHLNYCSVRGFRRCILTAAPQWWRSITRLDINVQDGLGRCLTRLIVSETKSRVDRMGTTCML
ncbi:hypothetical protein BCR44DRAFT_35413, partial [Catenaria anguillulae PL171]